VASALAGNTAAIVASAATLTTLAPLRIDWRMAV
jgi:hypothetical protein